MKSTVAIVSNTTTEYKKFQTLFQSFWHRAGDFIEHCSECLSCPINSIKISKIVTEMERYKLNGSYSGMGCGNLEIDFHWY